MAAEVQVSVPGLDALRRDLRAMAPAALKEVQQVVKGAAEEIAAEARRTAKRKTGRYAGGYRGTTSGSRGVVRNPVVYAGVQHWGGTIRPQGVPIGIKGDFAASKAMEARADRTIEQIARGLDAVSRKQGWH